jgi:hypothetical protein
MGRFFQVMWVRVLCLGDVDGETARKEKMALVTELRLEKSDSLLWSEVGERRWVWLAHLQTRLPSLRTQNLKRRKPSRCK